MKRRAFSKGRLLDAAEHMRALDRETRDKAIAASEDVIDARHWHPAWRSKPEEAA